MSCCTPVAPAPEIDEAAHADLVERAEQIVRYWHERLPWLYEWQLEVRRAEADAIHSLSIESAYFVRSAIIYVRHDAEEPSHFFNPNEYTLELGVLHELSHILFEPMRYVFMNWVMDEDESIPLPAHNALRDSEEVAVWHIARLIHSRHLLDDGEETAVWDSDRGA